jgi:phospholipase/carboxylesterase
MNSYFNSSQNLHEGQPVYAAGEAADQAQAAVVLIHGRGASAADILSLSPEIEQPGFAFLAPEAAGGQWYRYRFTEPVERNEPWLSSALNLVNQILLHLQQVGIPPERTVLLGFSQGACLALEYAARHPRRYGGLVGLSGGLIGAENELGPYSGSLEGTPVFLGCSDVDPHIPAERVRFTAGALRDQGAEVTMRFYPGMGHMVNQDELDAVRSMLEQLKKGSSKEG